MDNKMDAKISSDNAKVIPLPVRFSQQTLKVGFFPPPKGENFTQVRSRIVVSAAMVSIILGVTMVNKVMLDRPLTANQSLMARPSRSLASVQPQESLKNHRGDWTNYFKRHSLEKGQRSPASIGATPSVEDQLQFGFLEGKYAVTLSNGRLDQVRFVALSDQPKYLLNRQNFIEQFRDLFAPDFEVVRLRQRTENGRITHETYDLVAEGHVLAEVLFDLDLHGRLLSINVATQAE